MAPKVPEKQHTQHSPPQQQQRHQPLHSNSTAIKHSNPFHFSAWTLCHNKRLKLKRSKYAEYIRNAQLNNNHYNHATKQQQQKPLNSHKTEVRKQKLNSLQADVTIDLLSDDDEGPNNKTKQSVIVYPGRMCLERAAILGLMPVERTMNPPPLIPLVNNQQSMKLPQPPLMVPMPKQPTQHQPRKRKSKPQKRRSLPAPAKTPILLNPESIVLSDDSNDVAPIHLPATTIPSISMGVLQPPELSVTCPTSSQIPCLPQQNTMQVDEEVTISLVPRSLNSSNCSLGAGGAAPFNSNNCSTPNQDVFPMLPDETTVHTVIANRIYELSLTKLREGLASCGIPEFADGQQKISPQRRKGMVHQPPVVSPPQAPISLKLSSDLSISLISDDDEDEEGRQNMKGLHEPILSPAFLQKLPVNVSIAPVPLRTPVSSSHNTEPRKLKLG